MATFHGMLQRDDRKTLRRLLFKEKRSVADAARECGMPYRVCYEWAVQNGWTPGLRRGVVFSRPGHPALDPEVIRRMVKVGEVSVTALARSYGVSRARIYQVLDRNYKTRRVCGLGEGGFGAGATTAKSLGTGKPRARRVRASAGAPS